MIFATRELTNSLSPKLDRLRSFVALATLIETRKRLSLDAPQQTKERLPSLLAAAGYIGLLLENSGL